MSQPQPSVSTSARYALGMLLAVYMFNFVDRSILGILVPAIRTELRLDDTQLGLVGGTAFAIFYTALGVPVGRMADRLHRVRIIAAALALWSLFSALTGLAQNFAQLFLARLGVGVGEAGGVAPSYSLISDYFPVHRRARAFAIYSFGIPIGSAMGILFGGLLASRVNWRMPLLLVGALGLLLTPWFLRTVREPLRGGLDGAHYNDSRSARTPPPSDPAAGRSRVLLRQPSFWYLALGGALCSVPGYGLLFWLPSFLVRSDHMTLTQVAWGVAALTLCGGIAGLWTGGWLTDRLATRARSAYAWVPATAFLLCVPCYTLGMLTGSSPWRLVALWLPTTLALMWLAPTICAVQHLVRADQRAYASSAFLFVVNLIGLGLGSAIIGRLSDLFTSRYGIESLRYAILAVTGFYLLAAGLFALAAGRLERDWQA